MDQNIVVKGRRVRFRFLIFLVSLILLMFFLVRLILKQPLYDTIQYGEIITWEECTGLIVRDEKVYKAPDYGRIDYFVSDGELIEKDTLIAMVYKNNYDENLIDNLYNTKQKISDYQNKNIVKDIMDKDFNIINQTIDTTIKTIQYKNYQRDTKDLQRNEKELRGLLSRRKTLLDKNNYPDDYLDKLYDQEKTIEEKLDQWKIQVIAQDSGTISFKLDGLEDFLTPDILETLTLDDYLTFINHLNEPLESKDNEFETPLFKIFNPNKSYFVSLIDHKEVFLEEGDYVQFKFSEFLKLNFESIIYKVKHNKDNTLIILEIDEAIEIPFEDRKISANLGTTTKGLMIPNNAIIKIKDGQCIKLKEKDRLVQIPIIVKATDNQLSIVESKGINYNLEIGDSILVN